MTAISLKLSDLIVNELRQISKEIWITQKQAIEDSLRKWLVDKKKDLLIKQMKQYANQINWDEVAKKEELFLLSSLNDDYINNLNKEDVI